MENNENLVTDEIVTENTEQTAEETPVKTYTQEEVDAIVGKRIARNTAKIRKEYDREYGDLVSTLEAGTGKKGVGELNNAFREFYTSKGIKMQEKPNYTDKDLEVLAKADAEEIIRYGDEEAAEEFDRLEKLGTKMTARERATFKALADHLHGSEMGRELSKIGVSKDVYGSAEFKEFAAKFNPNTPITDVYNIYRQTQPKKEIKTMGSMRNNVANDSTVKDFYSYEEAMKFTKADFDKNPALYKAVEKSMAKWK